MAKENGMSENIVELPLSSVIIDNEWNGRSAWERSDVSDKGGNSMAELTESIKVNGQKRPVDVVKVKGDKFKLVTGYRRAAALTALGAKTIKAIIRDWDETKQRLENITENTERQDLRGADTCWSIGKYLETLKVEPNQETIGAVFGLSQSYVSKHMKILKSVKPEVIQAWRAGLPVGLNEGPRQDVGVLKFLSVAQVEPERQAEQWSLLLGVTPDGKKREKDPADKATGEAKRVGQILGRLSFMEVITVEGDFDSDLEMFVPSASGLPKGAKKAVAGVLALAFQSAKTKSSTPETEPETETA